MSTNLRPLPAPAAGEHANGKIHVSSWDVVEEVAFSPDSEYVEWYWLPVLGPSATLMYRRLHHCLAEMGGEADVDLLTLAAMLGLGAHFTKNSPVIRSLERLVSFRMARPTGLGSIELRSEAPVLSERSLSRLPSILQARHSALVAAELLRRREIAMRSHPSNSARLRVVNGG